MEIPINIVLDLCCYDYIDTSSREVQGARYSIQSSVEVSSCHDWYRFEVVSNSERMGCQHSYGKWWLCQVRPQVARIQCLVAFKYSSEFIQWNWDFELRLCLFEMFLKQWSKSGNMQGYSILIIEDIGGLSDSETPIYQLYKICIR